ncbi:leucyl/phenylalanyl-tRNA--protein transferase [Opitutales bacterium]|jgi:leucyl/phenylalanyl-tRNA--protein transferase|nr:leucyl/phenylalanyl-tRNA--protein transferase [Opitutales bacterium]
MGVVLLHDDLPEFFPDPREYDSEGLVAASHGLGVERLISAYRQGIFPWSKMHEPPHLWCWYSPDPRMVLYPGEFKASRSLAKVLREKKFEIRINHAFPEVIKACAEVPRPGQENTWIEPDMRREYEILNDLGIAHSVEAYIGEQLVGGLYGLAIGKAFFGESMFHYRPEASKVCMAKLIELAKEAGLLFIDCQVPNPFLKSLGAREVKRDQFLDQLNDACEHFPSLVNWPAKVSK